MKKLLLLLFVTYLTSCSSVKPELIGDVPSELKEKLVYAEGHLPYYFPELDEFGPLQDGVYVGELNGSLIDTGKVEVTIKNREISSVEIVDMKVMAPQVRKEKRIDEVFVGLPSQVLDKQSTSVDAVTAATGTTHVFKICVTRALWQASLLDDPLAPYSPY